MQVSFSMNGQDMGVAFSELRTFEPHLAYFPAVSLSQGEMCSVNLGELPFKYPDNEYRAITARTSEVAQLQCRLLLRAVDALAAVRSPLNVCLTSCNTLRWGDRVMYACVAMIVRRPPRVALTPRHEVARVVSPAGAPSSV